MFSALLTAVLSAVTPLPAAEPQALPDANPALWVVRDEDTTVYLFGTLHALDGRSDWFNDEVRSAFSDSDELVLETVLPSGRRNGLTRGASQSHAPALPTANFLGATRVAISAGADRGLDVRKGADMVLRRAAEDSGKTVEGLETIEFQLRMLSRLAAPGYKRGRPVPFDPEARTRVARLMTSMQASWNRGDQQIFSVLLDEMKVNAPENYKVMFPERNAHWADWVVNRMGQPGTVFVAVGAGHLAGRDSLLVNLDAKGVKAARLN